MRHRSESRLLDLGIGQWPAVRDDKSRGSPRADRTQDTVGLLRN